MDFIEKDKRLLKSSIVRAGKRTYFFDVKATSKGDYYLVMSESRHLNDNNYEKNKIFLYKEDLLRFSKGYEEAMAFIKSEKPDYFVEECPDKETDE